MTAIATVRVHGTRETGGAQSAPPRVRAAERGCDVILDRPLTAAAEGRRRLRMGRGSLAGRMPVDAHNIPEPTTAVADSLGASSVERLPTEVAITETTQRSKRITPAITAVR